MADECVFCGIVAGTVPSVPLVQDETSLAFMDINPATPGHLLVIPKRHSTDLTDIPPDDLAAVTLVAQRIGRTVIDVLGADGVNLINCCGAAAWQSVFHFHLHVIPRYRDRDKDRLELPWRPDVPADRNVLTTIGGKLAAALGG